MFQHILVSQPAPSITQITLNRPRQFNALAGQTFQELASAVTEFEQSPGQHVLILTGSGRAFCFGADFQEFQDRSRLPELLQSFQSLILQIYNCEKITIASLNGFATGAGLDLALACDFRIATDRVKLGEAYVSMGLVSDGGGSFFLPRMIGTARALHMLVTGESIGAEEARTLGLLTLVCTSEELPAKSLEFATAVAAKPLRAVSQLKQLVRANGMSDLASALRNEREAQLRCFEDTEHQQLVADFLSKRR